MPIHRAAFRLLRAAAIATPLALTATLAAADVTETRTMKFDMGIIKIDSTHTDRISGDKKRTDTQAKCDGFLVSMLCGNMQGGEIIRLDRSLTWTLEPKKKSYEEKPFPTPEQIAEAKQKMAAMIEKMKSCPQPKSAGPDTSKCEMSPPKFDIKKTDETAVIAGHETRRTSITLTQTCKNKDTGDACDFVFGFDLWLTQDELPGTAETRAFGTAYAKKLGFDQEAVASMITPQLQGFLAPYADAIKKVGAKASDVKGTPLRTRITVSVGGEHCATVKSHQGGADGNVVGDASGAAASAATSTASSAAVSSAASAAGRSGGISGAIAGSAAGAFGSKLIGGLFAKKAAAPAKPDAGSGSGSGSGAAPADTTHVTVVSITMETTSINTDAIAADQFEIPAGWKLIPQKVVKERDEPVCPPTGP